MQNPPPQYTHVKISTVCQFTELSNSGIDTVETRRKPLKTLTKSRQQDNIPLNGNRAKNNTTHWKNTNYSTIMNIFPTVCSFTIDIIIYSSLVIVKLHSIVDNCCTHVFGKHEYFSMPRHVDTNWLQFVLCCSPVRYSVMSVLCTMRVSVSVTPVNILYL